MTWYIHTYSTFRINRWRKWRLNNVSPLQTWDFWLQVVHNLQYRYMWTFIHTYICSIPYMCLFLDIFLDIISILNSYSYPGTTWFWTTCTFTDYMSCMCTYGLHTHVYTTYLLHIVHDIHVHTLYMYVYECMSCTSVLVCMWPHMTYYTYIHVEYMYTVNNSEII